jgi:hypothetical protein
MSIWEPMDKAEEGPRALRTHDACPERVERVRARCVAALEAAGPRPSRTLGWRDSLEPPFALGQGALYLAETVAGALAVYR